MDPFFKDDFTPIEPFKGNNKYCPVHILKSYMHSISHIKEPDSPLFSHYDDEF